MLALRAFVVNPWLLEAVEDLDDLLIYELESLFQSSLFSVLTTVQGIDFLQQASFLGIEAGQFFLADLLNLPFSFPLPLPLVTCPFLDGGVGNRASNCLSLQGKSWDFLGGGWRG